MRRKAEPDPPTRWWSIASRVTAALRRSRYDGCRRHLSATAKLAAASVDAMTAPACALSVTGPDGTGTCNQKFTSTSKRMNIAANDYWFGPPQDPEGPIKTTIPVGFEVKWNVYALHADTYPPSAIDASDATKEYPTTIIQGIPKGEHTLELTITGDAAPAIESIRVHRPPLN